MFDPKDFPFDAKKMAEFFSAGDFAKDFPDNAESLIATQKKNMEALEKANKAAAASFQTLFTKQIALFEKTMADAKTRIDNAKPDTSGDTAKAAFEQALQQMGDMAKTAQAANTEALEIVGKRAQESIKEMQELANKATKK
ncbi:MAG: phasin family protein [Rhodobacteraceae bacterium]|nr:phasin family protein [Paracoccaceae bacterium]